MNLHGKVWTRWRVIPPEPGQRVLGMYEGRDNTPSKGYACKRGCCFQIDGVGSCVIPTWWTDDTADHSTEVQK